MKTTILTSIKKPNKPGSVSWAGDVIDAFNGRAIWWLVTFLMAMGISVSGRTTENVIFVMTDGLRWQEVFSGAEADLMNKDNGNVKSETELKERYWREALGARRETLMPFVWNVMARQGQIFGNAHKGSVARVTNGLKFSYPGYSETLCGFVDPRVDSNDFGPNPNVTVLEWLNQKPDFHGRVAAFGAWDAFDRILNRERCGFYVNAAYAPMTNGPVSATMDLLNRLKAETPKYVDGEPYDSLEFHAALEYFKEHHPRVFYVSLGETDEWAHMGRYDEYLDAARRADQYVQVLWETAQSLPAYRGKTTIIFSPDHGRGGGLHGWRDHGQKVDGAENIWLAVMGPDTPALGERANVPDITQTQIAATIAALLGEDYCEAVPKAGKPIPLN